MADHKLSAVGMARENHLARSRGISDGQLNLQRRRIGAAHHAIEVIAHEMVPGIVIEHIEAVFDDAVAQRLGDKNLSYSARPPS
jgi:hypothetical protein